MGPLPRLALRPDRPCPSTHAYVFIEGDNLSALLLVAVGAQHVLVLWVRCGHGVIAGCDPPSTWAANCLVLAFIKGYLLSKFVEVGRLM